MTAKTISDILQPTFSFLQPALNIKTQPCNGYIKTKTEKKTKIQSGSQEKDFLFEENLPRDVLDGISDLIGSVSEVFPAYFYIYLSKLLTNIFTS